MTQLTTIFSQLHNLEKVSLGTNNCCSHRQNEEHNFLATFLPALLANNPYLEEVELIKNNDCYISLSLHHIALLKKNGVRLVRKIFNQILHPEHDYYLFPTLYAPSHWIKPGPGPDHGPESNPNPVLSRGNPKLECSTSYISRQANSTCLSHIFQSLDSTSSPSFQIKV